MVGVFGGGQYIRESWLVAEIFKYYTECSSHVIQNCKRVCLRSSRRNSDFEVQELRQKSPSKIKSEKMYLQTSHREKYDLQCQTVQSDISAKDLEIFC